MKTTSLNFLVSLRRQMALMCSVIAGALPAAGATITYDFTTDPTTGPNPLLITQAGFADSTGTSIYWKTNGGNPGGFLAITWPLGNSTTIAEFPNIDPGKIVTAFKFECDMRVGNPQQNVRAADGFSINFARASDDVFINHAASDFAAAGAAETGTKTGLAICFDTWSGNDLPDGRDFPDNGTVDDPGGIIIRVDNVTILRQPWGTYNGACADTDSLQTGSRDLPYWDAARAADMMPDAAFAPESWAGLCWQRFSAELDTAGKVTVIFKGRKILDQFQTSFFPSAGGIVLAGRTDGADEHGHFDNLTLTTTAVEPTGGPPEPPTNLRVVTAGARRVVLAWDASSTAQVAYQILRNGTLLPVLSLSTTFEDRGVAPSSTVSYKVHAVDLAARNSTDATVTATTVAEVESTFAAKAEYFTGITGVSVDDLVADAKYTANTPDVVEPRPDFESRTSFGDNYGGRLSAVFTPSETGDYVFFISANDHASLYLSTDHTTATKKLIAAEPDWNGIREWRTPGANTGAASRNLDTPENRSDKFTGTEWAGGNKITLVADKKYYLEALWKEGGGGDNCAVYVKKASDPDPVQGAPALTGTVLSSLADPVGASVTITLQPTGATAAENSPVSLTAAATATSPYAAGPAYQWVKDGKAILGANSATYAIPLVKKSQAGKYTVVAGVPGASATSSEVTVTVTDDLTPPTVASATSSDSFIHVTLVFSEPVAPSVPANYLIAGLAVTGVEVRNPTTVRLTTAKQTENTEYAITLTGIQDTATPPNPLAAPNNTVKFKAWAFTAGKFKFEFWDGILTVDLQALKDDPRYPNNPDGSEVRNAYEAPVGRAENFGGKLSGWITPKVTGSYVFFMASNDHGELYLSTDDTAANKVLIASEPDWNGEREWRTPGANTGAASRNVDAPENRSAPINLVLGRRYYSETLYKEGGGGDHASVTMKLDADPDPAQGSPALTGDLIGAFAPHTTSQNKAPTISSVPDQKIPEGGGSGRVTFNAQDVGNSPSWTAVADSLDVIVSLQSFGSVAIVEVVPKDKTFTGDVILTVTVSDNGQPPQQVSTTVRFSWLPGQNGITLGQLPAISMPEDSGRRTVLIALRRGSGVPSALLPTVKVVSSNQGIVTADAFYDGKDIVVSLSTVLNMSGSSDITVTVTLGAASLAAVVTPNTPSLFPAGMAPQAGVMAGTTFTVTVLPVNDVPTLSLILNEKVNPGTETGPISLVVGDVETAPENLVVTATANDPTKISKIDILGTGANKTINVIPASASTSGDVQITVTVRDAGDGTNPPEQTAQSFLVSFTGQPGSPTIGPFGDQTMNEDASLLLYFWLRSGVAAVPASSLTVSATSGDTAILPQSGITLGRLYGGVLGTITIRPAKDQNTAQTGSVTVRITVANGGLTDFAEFQLTVKPVNDFPDVSAIPNQTINEDEDTGELPFTVSDIDDPLDSLQLSANAQDNSVLAPKSGISFGGSGANRTVKVVPAPNQSGVATIFVGAKDPAPGGSIGKTFKLTVNPVNDAPSFTKGADQAVTVGAGAQTIAGWATAISAGPPDESGQAVSFQVSNDNNGLFSTQPAISADGTLTYTPAVSATGGALVTVMAKDDGGTENGGVDTSPPQTFTITIAATPVNDPPSFTKGANQTASENAGALTVPGWATAISAGPADESGQAVSFQVSNDNNALFSTQPAISPEGTLTYTPAAGATGTATLTVIIKDDGGIENGGQDTSGAQTFTITVTSVAGAPRITQQPKSQGVTVGANVTFDATITGAKEYQWRKNGQNIPGATGPALTIPNSHIEDGGSYTIAAASENGAVQSEIATLTFTDLGTLPFSDNFAGRGMIETASGTGTGNNRTATKEAGESNHAGKAGGKSVWLTWRAPAMGIATFKTAGSTFDTLLAVYRGDSLSSLTSIASDDDSGGFFTSLVQFNAEAGIDYQIAVDGFVGAAGDVVLAWNLETTADLLPVIVTQPSDQTVAPGNVALFQVAVSPAEGNQFQWLFNGSELPGETNPQLTRANAQAANVGTYAVRVTRGNRSVTSRSASLQLAVVSDGPAGQTPHAYDKFGDAYAAATGQAQPASGRVVRRPAAAPARGFTGHQIFSSHGGTTELNEPLHCEVIGGASMWFAYLAEAAGTLTIDTKDSTFDTVLAVYTGTGADFESLTPVACNNDAAPPLRHSRVSFPARAGTTYFVAVDGVAAASGVVQLNYALTGALRLLNPGLSLGVFAVQVTAPAGERFSVQASEDLIAWRTITTTSSPDGTFSFQDPELPTLAKRFYRVILEATPPQ